MGRLVDALHEQGLVAQKRCSVPVAAPECEESDQRDTFKRKVDPVGLLLRWTEDCPTSRPLSVAEVESTLLQIEQMLKKLPGPVIDLALPEMPEGLQDSDPRLIVVGDLHGQLADVLHIFHEHGTPGPLCVYLFNGDITDRGPEAVEIWMLVLAFKLRFPEHVHILRGNHENEKLNARPRKWGGGFSDECNAKYPPHIFNIFNRMFTVLPLFAVVHSEIFVVHAGLFRAPDVTVEQLRSLPYREHYPEPPQQTKLGTMTRGPWSDEETVLFDAQWSDPQAKPGIGASKRGKAAIGFGPDITEQFLRRNGLSLVIRSHEVPKTRRGFDVMHNGRLMTVFSASNYGGLLGNTGAVAVIRRGPPATGAPAGPVQLKLATGLTVQCVEHEPALVELKTGAGLRQARSAAKVLREFQGSSGEAADEAVRHALGLIFLERDELELRCNALDVHRNGCLSFSTVVEELKQVCGEFDWGGLLHKAADFGEEVSYRNLFDAVKVQWRALGQTQTAALAEAMLAAELHLDALVDLFDFTKDGFVAPSELRRALKLLLPNLSEEQLRGVRKLFGEKPLSLSELVQVFLKFLPPLNLPEKWMREALLQLGHVIQRWAGPGVELHAALLQFYTVYDEDRDGILSVEELMKSFEELELQSLEAMHSAASGVLLESSEYQRLSPGKLKALAMLLDTNRSDTISFLEFARGFQKPESHSQRPKTPQEELFMAQTTWTASIFVYRMALIHCCRLMDISCSGCVSSKDFVAVVATLGDILGRQFPRGELLALESSIGSQWFDYQTALNDFSVLFDASLATRMGHSIMLPF